MQIRLLLIRVVPIGYSGKQFINSSPDNQLFIGEQKVKSVWNFRTFTEYEIIAKPVAALKKHQHDQTAIIHVTSFHFWSIEPRHVLSNNVVCATCKCSDQPAFEYSMTVKLLADQHLEFPSLKGGCTGLSESILVRGIFCPSLGAEFQLHSYRK